MRSLLKARFSQPLAVFRRPAAHLAVKPGQLPSQEQYLPAAWLLLTWQFPSAASILVPRQRCGRKGLQP